MAGNKQTEPARVTWETECNDIDEDAPEESWLIMRARVNGERSPHTLRRVGTDLYEFESDGDTMGDYLFAGFAESLAEAESRIKAMAAGRAARIDLIPETVGSRARPRNRFRIIADGDEVGHVEADEHEVTPGVVLRGKPFGRYGARILDQSIDRLRVKPSDRDRLRESIRDHLALAKL